MNVKRMLSLAVAGLALAAAAERNEKPLKVLMVGNSFSICVLSHAPAIAKDLGCKLDLCSLYIGGCSLQQHAGNLVGTNTPYDVSWNYGGDKTTNAIPFAARVTPVDCGRGNVRYAGNLRAVLAGDRWDVVTIQQASHESAFADSYEPYAGRLVAAIRKLAPQAEIRVQQTWSYAKTDARVWSRADGLGTWKRGKDTFHWNQADMFGRLEENYRDLTARYGLKTIPTGRAIQLYRERKPVAFVPPTDEEKAKVTGPDSLPATDDPVGNFGWDKEKKRMGCDSIHLNDRGEYLQGLVWVGALFDVDPTGVNYRPSDRSNPVSEEDAQLLKACARDALRAQGYGLAGLK